MKRLTARYVAWSRRRTGWILGGLILLFFGTVWPALGLELHTDLTELLPDEHPAVRALRTIAPRQKSATNLVLLLHSPDPDANRRFVDALHPLLEKLIPEVFTEIQWKPNPEVPDYARRWRWLYIDLPDLQKAERLVDRIIAGRTSPLWVDLEGDAERELRELRERWNELLPVRHAGERFQRQETATHYLGVMMWRRRDGLASRGDLDTLALVKATVKELDPSKFHPKMKVEYTGHIAQAVDEQNGIRSDLALATVVCCSLVLLVIYLYFRRAALILVIGAPAVLGVMLSLVLARVTIHFLNINTAFLISIILGNGINSAIILLARYGEERRHGREVDAALSTALAETFLGTLSATLAASIAYGCLLLTSFRGFNQFGLLGGVGMAAVWILTFVMVPPLVIFGERRWPGRLTPGANLWRRPFAWIGRQADRRPWLPAMVSLLLVAIAAVPLNRYVEDPLEWNFDHLRTDETAAQRLWPRMEELGMGNVGAGYIGNDGVLLVDEPAQADTVAEAMRQKDRALGPRHVLKTVRTLHSTLPDSQSEKLAILGRLRSTIDRHREMLDDDEQRELESWRPPEYLRALTLADLPRQVVEAFTEIDGQRGRLIGIDADPATFQYSNLHDLLRISKSLQVDALGKTWVAASAGTIFAAMLEAIIHDGPRVTLAALAGVTLLVLLLFGIRGALPVLVALAIGMVWLGGAAGAIHLKLNFMNFVALPITLGIGTEYAANIWARLRREGVDQIGTVIADSGSAVALCSMTTIIGYSSLLLSSSRALRSFGLLADLGEVTCLVAAVVALPAIVKLARRDRRA